jgi:hypothetical protein
MNFQLSEKVLLGEPATMQWNPSIAGRFVLIYNKKAFWYWKNCTLIKNTGTYNTVVDSKEFCIEIFKFSLLGLKSIIRYKPEVKVVTMEGLDSSIKIGESRVVLDNTQISKYNFQLLKGNISTNPRVDCIKIHLKSINLKNNSYGRYK